MISYPSGIYRVGDCDQNWLVVVFAHEDHARGMPLRHSIRAHGEGAEIEGVHCQHVQYPRLLRGTRDSIDGQKFVRIIFIREAQLPHNEFIVSAVPGRS